MAAQTLGLSLMPPPEETEADKQARILEATRYVDALANWTPKQEEALRATGDYRFVLFGGARGPGKSYWLRWSLVWWLKYWAALGITKVRVMLACEDYPQLYERQLSKIETEFPDSLGYYHGQRNEYRLHPEHGGGVIAFRNLDKPAKYVSAEFAIIAIDEIIKNTFRTFNTLRGSLRWPGIARTMLWGACNPAPNWVRQLWIERDFPKKLEPLAKEFYFVKALPQDNRHLSDAYWDDLNTQDESQRDAWVDGNWYVTVEGVVYEKNFGNENITTDEPDQDVDFELGFDDGYVDPRAILFIQRTATRILVFDEIYHSHHLESECVEETVDRCGFWFGWEAPGLQNIEALEALKAFRGYRADARALVERMSGEAWDGEIRPRKLPEIAVGSHEAITLHKLFQRANIISRKKPHSIVEGIKKLRSLFKDSKGYRALHIHARCANLIAEITTGYKYPDTGRATSDEKPEDKNNHACDALRYWAWLRA